MFKLSSLLVLFSVTLVTGCMSYRHASQGEIETIMNAQQLAWNKGDLVGFMKGYWENDSLRFMGKGGVTCGWKSTLERYQMGYSSQSQMGKLQFSHVRMEHINRKNVYVDGKWTLFREADTLSGHFTLLWKKINNQWVIVSDHSS
ncbi:MAG: YybH family protein [Bacteroidota bacterium]|jgi:hypothetical protein